MTDTSRRRVLNNAFQVLKPPCLQRVRCFAVVAAVFFIRGILNDPWLLGRPWRQESWGPIAVATNWCQWERALGLGLWGLGLGLRGLGNGLLGGLGRLRRGVLTAAFAPKALASGKLWQQCAGSHRIAASAAPLALAVGSGQVLLGHLPGEQPKVEALVVLPFRFPFINTCSFMYQGGGGDSHQWAARCFLYRYTRTAASGEGTQTSHVSMCIVQYRETSIQPHVLNTEHMKAPGMQADT